jgi:hypothetical protein
MNKKIIGIVICMLLIGTCILPLVSSIYKDIEYNNHDDIINEDCRCHTEKFFINGISIMNDPLFVYEVDEDINFEIIDDLPNYFNWRDHEGQDWTTSAKNQGNCGSCWDFAALGALESVINIREGIADLDPDLSEQYVLSCLPKAANNIGKGCLGGDPRRAFKCILKDDGTGNYCNGIIPEICMPYQASDEVPCEEKCEEWEKYLVPITDYGYKWWLNHTTYTLDQIKTRIIEGGPVAAGMNVTQNFSDWGYINHNPTDYYPETYENWDQYLNHLIVIVGWNDDDTIGNGGYWICKNSWGDIFGYDGFFNIEYGALFTGWYTAWVEYDPEDYNWHPIPKTNGPYYALTNEIINFIGNAEGENPPFTWHWDFGDNSTSTEQNPTHIYSNPGEYTVILTVTDDNDNSFYEKTFAWIQEANDPPEPPTIEGPTLIKKDEYCWYNFTFSDPDGNSLYLYISAFGIDSGVWWGPYPPEGKEYINYYWDEPGEYVVKAKVKDPYNAESDWTILNVTVEKSKSIEKSIPSLFFEKLIYRFPLFERILNQII